jgi:hypothetical protein
MQRSKPFTEEEYIESINNSLKIKDLVVGKKYLFITKKGYEYLGQYYEKKTEIESECWHDGPEFDIRLKFENPIFNNKTFYSIYEQGFIEVDY